MIIADRLAAFVDPALAHYRAVVERRASGSCSSAYSFQLYFDFAGYSDMAVGLGYMFGIRIPINFNSPYKALDPSDFWRRWHISLSSCLRDYIYIPLGGNRYGESKTYRNLMLTMLIGGLWHGASWTFVVVGRYHGLLLALYRRFGAVWDRLPATLRQAAMFVLVMIGWVMFRSTDFSMAWTMITRLFVWTPAARLDDLAGLLLWLGLAAGIACLGPNANDCTPARGVSRRAGRSRWRLRLAPCRPDGRDGKFSVPVFPVLSPGCSGHSHAIGKSPPSSRHHRRAKPPSRFDSATDKSKRLYRLRVSRFPPVRVWRSGC